MSKESQLQQVLDCGIVAVVRSPDSQQLAFISANKANGGKGKAQLHIISARGGEASSPPPYSASVLTAEASPYWTLVQ